MGTIRCCARNLCPGDSFTPEGYELIVRKVLVDPHTNLITVKCRTVECRKKDDKIIFYEGPDGKGIDPETRYLVWRK